MAAHRIKLKFGGTCLGCRRRLLAGWTAWWSPITRNASCLKCGPGVTEGGTPLIRGEPAALRAELPAVVSVQREMVGVVLPHETLCAGCGRQLSTGDAGYVAVDDSSINCDDCAHIDMFKVVGSPGSGARKQRKKLVEAAGEGAEVGRWEGESWRKGAVGEEQVGQRLSDMPRFGRDIRVLHDRKLPQSEANVDHIVITPAAVWVIDVKRYNTPPELRRWGEKEVLHIRGEDHSRLLSASRWQAEQVRQITSEATYEGRIEGEIKVVPAVLFLNINYKILSPPCHVDGVWLGGWATLHQQLLEEREGPVPLDYIAKRLARKLRAG